jgi:protein tyrosine phosphatase (PTP) superfamily phosphohydrolase (DUF442 family)
MARYALFFIPALALIAAGCQTHRTSMFGPSCPSCGGGVVPAPESRYRPTPPPPLLNAVPPVPREEGMLRSPSLPPAPPEGETGPIARLGPPRAKIDSTKPVPKSPETSVPGPDDETPPPIDLPGFVIARPGVATALMPFPDGIDWLAKKGYRTALHLKPASEDGAAAKRQFEKKGITYIALDVSPAALTAEVVEEFSKVVQDTGKHPLIIYDKDGSLSGGLWYLHHRLTLKATDEKARAEATRLGLRMDDDAEHKTVWIAIQALLKKTAP